MRTSIAPRSTVPVVGHQRQLGLKLSSERDPVNVLVIDRADHPTED